MTNHDLRIRLEKYGVSASVLKDVFDNPVAKKIEEKQWEEKVRQDYAKKNKQYRE